MDNNSLGYWVWYLFIGAIVGWLAGLITRGRGFGILGDMVVGIVGAILGGWMARVLGIYPGSSIGSFLIALVGAIVLVILTRFIKRAV